MKAWSRPRVPELAPDRRRPRVFDTATGALVEVGPVAGEARLYVCGVTPYDTTHLGHANTYVAFDLLQRAWLDAGLAVDYTQNVTDVDDPLLERAAATGVAWEELALEQTDLFRTDMEALRVLPPRHYVGAVESIPLVLELIEALMPTGLIYQVADADHPDWYFDCPDAAGFGAVAHLPAAWALAWFAERGGDPERPGKRHQLDCLVWRLARPGEPAWDGPLGRGRPGWHIECTAIALHHLGPCFDVQGGGSDLAFPHHEMCAAQGRAATGVPFARTFVHSGMVGYQGEKMSKSRGNLVRVSTLREAGVDPMAIRLALLAHHYRSDWEWTDVDLTAAQARLASWRGMHALPTALPAGAVVAAVRDAVRDDLDAPAALAAVDAWVGAHATHAGRDTRAVAEVAEVVDALLGVRL